MSIKRYIADKDTTISDAYKPNLYDRAYDSNIGAADSLEMFSLYGQVANSIEKSRILIGFPAEDIKKDRETSKIPLSGSVKFFLRLYNVKHPFSLPRDYKAQVSVISSSWDEGYGLDMENYSDYGWNNIARGSGATWKFSLSGTLWENQGGDILDDNKYNFDYYFKDGTEDIDLDITNVVEEWISGDLLNNGLLIKMSGSYEDGSLNQSFYTKKFSARGSEFFYKKPCIEARWEAVSTDDRQNFYVSSSALSDIDNKMNLYFYHNVNGRMKNIKGDILPSVKYYSDDKLINEVTSSFLQISNPAAGVYRASVIIDTTASVLYDVWYNTSSFETYFSSSFDILQREHYDFDNQEEYIINITNNKLVYNSNENTRFNIFARKKDWQPTIYKKAYNNIENSIINDLYYKIFRLNDNYVVVDYSTGSIAYTKTSYNSKGNYFDLDMSIFETKYNYGIKLARWDGINLKEFPTIFKFKVE